MLVVLGEERNDEKNGICMESHSNLMVQHLDDVQQEMYLKSDAL